MAPRKAVKDHTKLTRQMYTIRQKGASKKNEWYATMLANMDEVLDKGGRIELQARHSGGGDGEREELNEHTEQLKKLVAASKL